MNRSAPPRPVRTSLPPPGVSALAPSGPVTPAAGYTVSLVPRLVEMHAVADRVAQAIEVLQEHVELGRTVTLRTIDLRPGDDEAAIVQCRELRLEAGGAGKHDRRRVQRDPTVGILSECDAVVLLPRDHSRVVLEGDNVGKAAARTWSGDRHHTGDIGTVCEHAA